MGASCHRSPGRLNRRGAPRHVLTGWEFSDGGGTLGGKGFAGPGQILVDKRCLWGRLATVMMTRKDSCSCCTDGAETPSVCIGGKNNT